MNKESLLNLLTMLNQRTSTLKELREEYPMISGCRTYSKAIEAVTEALEGLSSTPKQEGLGLEPEAKGDEAVEQPKSYLEELTDSILKALASVDSQRMQIANLLFELKGEFTRSSAFIEYAKLTFGLSQNSIYRYLRMRDFVNKYPCMDSAPLRVIQELYAYKYWDSISDAILYEAEQNSLSTDKMLEIMQEYEDSLKPQSKPEPEQSQAEATEAQHVPDEAAVSDDEEDDTPFDAVDSEAAEAPSETQAAPVNNLELEGLIGQVQALTVELAEANRTIQALSKSNERKDKQGSAPMLPQFKSNCLYARLGLAAEEAEDAQSIRSAFRELVKAGYGEGHQAYALIKEARDGLL